MCTSYDVCIPYRSVQGTYVHISTHVFKCTVCIYIYNKYIAIYNIYIFIYERMNTRLNFPNFIIITLTHYSLSRGYGIFKIYSIVAGLKYLHHEYCQ